MQLSALKQSNSVAHQVLVDRFPELRNDKNKEIAILLWNRDKDKEIIRAMNKGKSMFFCARFGIDSTPYGKICWALSKSAQINLAM